jgi:hypothetical protein
MSPQLRNVLGWFVCLVLVTVALFGFAIGMIASPKEVPETLFKAGMVTVSFGSAVLGLKLKDWIAGKS